jgi:hypothetical protein
VTVSAPLDPALLGPERPRLDKLSLQILEDAPGRLDVTLSVLLDPASADERAAVEAFAPEDRLLDVRYLVEMNLAAERDELARRFEAMYRRHPVRAALTSDALEVVPDDRLRDAFMPIAAQGSSIFRRLLQPRQLLNYAAADAPCVRAALRSALERAHLVAVKSPVSLFPWTFLYDGAELDETNLTTFDASRFWGLRHQIQEEIEGASRRVRLSRPPRIVAAVSPDVDPGGEHREGPLGRLAAEHPESVHWIASAEALRRSLADFQGDCLYFYGHAAQGNPPTPTTSYLLIDGFKLTVDRIDQAGGPRFQKELVLAFLNGCETTPLHVWSKDSLAGFLCLQGDHRVCCVTTFAEVPIAFGRRFGQLLWERFLGGARLGEALLEARREMVRRYNSPLGLLYALFGRVETRFG